MYSFSVITDSGQVGLGFGYCPWEFLRFYQISIMANLSSGVENVFFCIIVQIDMVNKTRT